MKKKKKSLEKKTLKSFVLTIILNDFERDRSIKRILILNFFFFLSMNFGSQ